MDEDGVLLDSEELLREKFLSIVCQGKEQGKLTGERYEELLLLPLGSLDELEKAYHTFQLYLIDHEYEELLSRIVKGAEFLENPNIHPDMYEKGLQKYDRLCEEFMAVKKRYLDYVLGRESECEKPFGGLPIGESLTEERISA
jgi:hypothetical protein